MKKTVRDAIANEIRRTSDQLYRWLWEETKHSFNTCLQFLWKFIKRWQLVKTIVRRSSEKQLHLHLHKVYVYSGARETTRPQWVLRIPGSWISSRSDYFKTPPDASLTSTFWARSKSASQSSKKKYFDEDHRKDSTTFKNWVCVEQDGGKNLTFFKFMIYKESAL